MNHYSGLKIAFLHGFKINSVMYFWVPQPPETDVLAYLNTRGKTLIMGHLA